MSKRRALATACVGLLAGFFAGIVTGAGARVAMRMVAMGVADGVGVRPEFTIEGTASILVACAVVGAEFGVVYMIVAGRLPVPRQLAGLTFGVVLLVVFGPFFLINEEFFSAGRVLLFALLFPAFGVALSLAMAPSRWFVERFNGPTDSALDLFAFAAPTTLSRVGAGALAGAIAGMGAGIGARLSMRMVADGFPLGIAGPTTFTAQGTATIVIFGCVIGALAGVIYGAIVDRIPGPHLMRALLFSAIPFALTQLLVRQPALLVFALPFLVYGIGLGVLQSVSERIVSRARLAPRRLYDVQSQ